MADYQQRVALMGGAEGGLGASAGMPPPGSGVGGGEGASTVGGKRIRCKADCHLALLQHWSLAEALFNSPFVATRLRTWRQSGREKVELMLAKMGFPLVQCRQHWTHMRPQLKRDLSLKLQ